jgi:hypothetical protein
MITALFAAGIAAAQDTPQPASISGQLINVATGQPIPGADVSYWVGSKEVDTKTDDSGRYKFTGLTPGSGHIMAEAPMPSMPGFGAFARRYLTLSPGQDLTGIDVRIRPYGEISGKVLDENKEPIPGMSVYLLAREYSSGSLRYIYASGAVADDEGAYSMKRVEPGRGYLLVAQNPFAKLDAISNSPDDPRMRKRVAEASFYPGVPDIEAASVITLRPGEMREAMNITVVKGSSFCIEGKALLGDHPGALSFDIAPPSPTSGQSGNGGMYMSRPGGTTGRDGVFRICNLTPGPWQITMSQYDSQAHQFKSYGSQMVIIKDADLSGVGVSASPLIPVAGEVVWDGAPPNDPVNATLTIRLSPIARAGDVTAKSSLPGAFSFDGLTMTDYAATITGLRGNFYLKDVTYADRSVRFEPLRPGSASGDAVLRVVVARDGGIIQAKVTDKDGNAISDSFVTVIPAAAASEAMIAASYVSGQTDQTGTWKTGALAPGKYYVVASDSGPDKTPETIAKLVAARSRVDPVEVGPNATVTATVVQKEME